MYRVQLQQINGYWVGSRILEQIFSCNKRTLQNQIEIPEAIFRTHNSFGHQSLAIAEESHRAHLSHSIVEDDSQPTESAELTI